MKRVLCYLLLLALALFAFAACSQEPQKGASSETTLPQEPEPINSPFLELERLSYGMKWSEASALLDHEYALTLYKDGNGFATCTVDDITATILLNPDGEDSCIDIIHLLHEGERPEYLPTGGNGQFLLPGRHKTNPELFYDVTLFDQIEPGMELSEVISLLGAPGIDIGSGIVYHLYYCSDGSSTCIGYHSSGNGTFAVFSVVNDKKALIPSEDAIPLSAVEQVRYEMPWSEAHSLLGDSFTILSANRSFVTIEYIVAYEGRAILTLSPHIYSDASTENDPDISSDIYADYPVRKIVLNGRELATDRFGCFVGDLDTVDPDRLFSAETFPQLSSGMSAREVIDLLQGFGVLHTYSLPDKTIRNMFYLSDGSIRYVTFSIHSATNALTLVSYGN